MHLAPRPSTLVLLVLLLCPNALGEEECLYLSDAKAVTDIETAAPFRVGYQGFYPRSTEGITATAYLDRQHVARYLTLVFHGETGRTTVAVRFDTDSSYSISQEVHSYEKAIQEGGGKIETLDSRECYVVRDGQIQWSSPGSDPESGTGLIEEVELVLDGYMACELSFPHPATDP